MLTTQTVENLREMKFHGMLKGLEEQLANPDYQSMSFEERLGILVDREKLERDNRKIATRLRQASLPVQASVQDVDYGLQRSLDKSLVLTLGSGRWISDSLNLIISGPTGVGKSFLASALAHQACFQDYRVKYLRIPRFFQELEMARGDGSYLKLLKSLSKIDLLILDDWGLAVMGDRERRDLLEVLEDRHNRKSTMVTSQFAVSQWHELIGDPTLADAILDRLVHNAYQINLTGESVRKKKSKLTNPKA